MAFNKWKIILNNKQKVQSQMVMFEEQEMQTNLQNEVTTLTKEIEEKTKMKDESGKRSTGKLLVKFDKRLMRLAFGRWKGKTEEK